VERGICPIAESFMTDTVIYCSCPNCWPVYSRQDPCSLAWARILCPVLVHPRSSKPKKFMIIYIHHHDSRHRFPVRCRNFSDSVINKGYIAYFSRRMRLLQSEIWCHHHVPWPRFPIWWGSSGNSWTFKAEISIFMFAWIFRNFWPKMAVLGAK